MERFGLKFPQREMLEEVMISSEDFSFNELPESPFLLVMAGSGLSFGLDLSLGV